MTLLSTMRGVPGQLGGGLGRVVEVRDLPGSRASTGGLRTVQVVLEKSAASSATASSFSNALAEYNGETEAAAPSFPLASTVVTTIQEYAADDASSAPAGGGGAKQQAASSSSDDTTDESTATDSDEQQIEIPIAGDDTNTDDFLKDLLPALGEVKEASSIPALTTPGNVLATSGGDLFSRMRLAASAYAGLMGGEAAADASVSA